MLFLKPRLYLGCRDKAIGRLILYVNVHLAAHIGRFIGLVERGESGYEVDTKGDVTHQQQCFLPVEAHERSSVSVVISCLL